MATGSLNVSTNSKIENDIVELKNKDIELGDTLNTKANNDDIAIKSTSGDYIQLTDAKNASMLLRYSDVNLLKPSITSATTRNGITVTPNSDGSFTVTGTCTSSDTTYVDIGTFSGIPYGEKFYFNANAGNIDWGAYIHLNATYSYNTDGVYSCKNVSTERVSLAIRAGYTVDKRFYPMISLRDTNACVPYSGYTITSFGKNLAKPVSNGWANVNFYPNNDGSITIKKTGTSSDYYGIGKAYLMAGKRYRFSLFGNSVMSGKYQLYLGEYTGYPTGAPYYYSFIATKTAIRNITIKIIDESGDNFEDTLYIQLEVGDYTDFEPCKSTEITINNDTIFPITGLQSYDGITNVYNSYGVPMDVCYATNESGQTILDSIANINNKTGSTDISSIGDGTITGAIKTLQEKIDAL